MASLALTVLTLTLGAFFIFVGQLKITSQFFPDIHEDMVTKFHLNYFKIIYICILETRLWSLQ
jgi:hypothetical protein